jgi:hypothetical protein
LGLAAAFDAAARTLAAWWSQRREVTQVLHPALPGAPGHEFWKQLCSRSAGLFSVVFNERYSADQVNAFIDALQLLAPPETTIVIGTPLPARALGMNSPDARLLLSRLLPGRRP